MWQLNYWSIVIWGGKSRHFLWQRKLWYLKIVLLITETSSTLMVIISLLSPCRSVLGWQRFHISNKLSFYSDFEWGSHRLTGQILRLDVILCSPQPLDPLSNIASSVYIFNFLKKYFWYVRGYRKKQIIWALEFTRHNLESWHVHLLDGY